MEKTNNSRIAITTLISIIAGCSMMLFSGLFLDSFILAVLVVFVVAITLASNVVILSALKERRWEYVPLLVALPIIYFVVAPIISQKLCAYGEPLHELYQQFNNSANPYSGLGIICIFFVGATMSLASLIMSILSIRKKQKLSQAAAIKAPKNRIINKILPLIALLMLLVMAIIGVISYK